MQALVEIAAVYFVLVVLIVVGLENLPHTHKKTGLGI
jgi:hypothetical protein